jgi:hypothetical protein
VHDAETATRELELVSSEEDTEPELDTKAA